MESPRIRIWVIVRLASTKSDNQATKPKIQTWNKQIHAVSHSSLLFSNIRCALKRWRWARVETLQVIGL
jgi:hypothetical protein